MNAYAIVSKKTNEVITVELTRKLARQTKGRMEQFDKSNKSFKIVQMVPNKEVR